MWATLLFQRVTFAMQLIINVLAKSLHEDLGEDSGSWTHAYFTLTGRLMWPTLIFHPH